VKISAFTFIRNATKLYIPIKESIQSLLPIVDEYVIAIGKGDETDESLAEIESINSPKIKLIHTEWEIEKYPKNSIYARQTDIAKEACTGDWLFYLQGDEAIHESDFEKITSACKKYLHDKEVEGFLFKYYHFWGDYEHYHKTHDWYFNEIRIIRNLPEIHSWKDAQSFRKFKSFDYSAAAYLSTLGSQKLKVLSLDAYIYHYGAVRPPHLMSIKKKSSSTTFRGAQKTQEFLKKMPDEFDYGPLHKLPLFNGTHPKAMHAWIKKFDWKHKLQYSGKRNTNRPAFKHEKFKYRFLSFFEHRLLGGKAIGGFKNYIELKR
jgi:hypothetical protein